MSSLSLTTTGTTGTATYNSTTGVLNIPNYADTSKLVLHTNGGGGPATFTSPTLNVPIYAPQAINQVLFSTSANRSTGNLNPTSTGFGVSFTAMYNASVLINYFSYGANNTANAGTEVFIYRTTGTIPASGVLISGDVQVAFSQFFNVTANGPFSVTGIIYDTTLTVGIPYSYYLAFSTSAGNTYTMNSGAQLQLTEAK